MKIVKLLKWKLISPKTSTQNNPHIPVFDAVHKSAHKYLEY